MRALMSKAALDCGWLVLASGCHERWMLLLLGRRLLWLLAGNMSMRVAAGAIVCRRWRLRNGRLLLSVRIPEDIVCRLRRRLGLRGIGLMVRKLLIVRGCVLVCTRSFWL